MHQIKTFLVVLVCLFLLALAPAVNEATNGAVPIVVEVSPSSVQRGDTVWITVYLDQTADQNQSVSITSSSNTAFSYLPSSVTVLQNHISVTFSATVSQTATVGGTVSASANGGTATSPMMAIRP